MLLATTAGPVTAHSRWEANGGHAALERGVKTGTTVRKVLGWCTSMIVLAGVVWGAVSVVKLLAQLSGADWLRVGKLTSLTFVRVSVAVAIGTLWTVPVGVAVGFSAKLSRLMQPVIQMMASFPAPMLYPIVLIVLHAAGVSINFGAVVLILMGTQWYILFNVIAGAMALPQDLREVAVMYRMGRIEKWRRLILPGIFPYLVTGWVTAAGGAWNASIVAEYVPFKKETLVADGVGAAISVATAGEHFAMLAACVLAMCVAVVGINRIVWKRLYNVAEEKFALTK